MVITISDCQGHPFKPTLVGSGAPSDANGENEDVYLRTSNGAVYQKLAGIWGSPIAYIPLSLLGTAALLDVPSSGDATSGQVVKGSDTRLTDQRTPTNDSVTNAKLANMAVNTIKGRVTAGTGDPEDLTATQARSALGLGGAAVLSVGVIAGTVAAGDDARLGTAEIAIEYQYQTGGFPAAPMTVASDNATPSSITSIVVSDHEIGNNSQLGYLNTIIIGDTIKLSNLDNSKCVYGRITNVSYSAGFDLCYTFTISNLACYGSAFAASERVQVAFISKLIPGGSAGELLTWDGSKWMGQAPVHTKGARSSASLNTDYTPNGSYDTLVVATVQLTSVGGGDAAGVSVTIDNGGSPYASGSAQVSIPTPGGVSIQTLTFWVPAGKTYRFTDTSFGGGSAAISGDILEWQML